MNSISITSGILELARPHVTTLAEELDEGRDIRITSVARIVSEMPNGFVGWDTTDAAYEVRGDVANDVGDELADEDDVEGLHGIPAIEACITLSLAYGDDWLRLAYADYLTHFSEVPCCDPYAVASAVVKKAEARYHANKLMVAA
ncbi:hypothetical protein [Cognatiluteimonas profundi]|uniref:hypothetical protein n=1 Tax=Cognatiluteimonas profundi TaxID=2594501 RepID=UPI00131D93C7|nr:hypothetical protein [Lysobacter profundi]